MCKQQIQKIHFNNLRNIDKLNCNRMLVSQLSQNWREMKALKLIQMSLLALAILKMLMQSMFSTMQDIFQ